MEGLPSVRVSALARIPLFSLRPCNAAPTVPRCPDCACLLADIAVHMTATQHMHTVHGRCSGLLSTERSAKVPVDMFGECLQAGVQLVLVLTSQFERKWRQGKKNQCLDSHPIL